MAHWRSTTLMYKIKMTAVDREFSYRTKTEATFFWIKYWSILELSKQGYWQLLVQQRIRLCQNLFFNWLQFSRRKLAMRKSWQVCVSPWNEKRESTLWVSEINMKPLLSLKELTAGKKPDRQLQDDSSPHVKTLLLFWLAGL